MNIIVKPLEKSAAVSAGVPEDLAERTVALLVLSNDGCDGVLPAAPGSVVLLGQGDDIGVYTDGDGRFSLLAGRGTAGEAGRRVALGSVVGILKKFGD